jgi:hypothetical protein
LQIAATYTDQGAGTGEPIKPEKFTQCVEDVTCKGTQTSVLKTAETCAQAGLITREASTQKDAMNEKLTVSIP